MISNLQKKILLVCIFSYILFFQINTDEFHLMIILSLITAVISYIFINDDLYEGQANDSIQFTAEEEEMRRQQQMEESDETITETTAETTEDVPIAANTPFVSAEYVRLRDEARKEDGDLEITDPDESVTPVLTENDSPEGTGPTEPESTSDKKMFEEKEEVKMIAVNDKFRMGPYDGLCISSEKLMENNIIDNKDLVTYFGFQIPPSYVSSQDVLTGPTVDGKKGSPQKLSMFANNKTSLNCCKESPFMTSTGCICLTEDQRNFIQTRGFNKTEGDI